jgi:hypothetical protein
MTVFLKVKKIDFYYMALHGFTEIKDILFTLDAQLN